jgi:hypothetical protein
MEPPALKRAMSTSLKLQAERQANGVSQILLPGGVRALLLSSADCQVSCK